MRLIDADALLKEMRVSGKAAYMVVQDAPAIEAEPVRHGRWVGIKGMAPPEYHGKHRCSICYARALERKFYEELSDYCPNCGAKMDGDSHE